MINPSDLDHWIKENDFDTLYFGRIFDMYGDIQCTIETELVTAHVIAHCINEPCMVERYIIPGRLGNIKSLFIYRVVHRHQKQGEGRPWLLQLFKISHLTPNYFKRKLHSIYGSHLVFACPTLKTFRRRWSGYKYCNQFLV